MAFPMHIMAQNYLSIHQERNSCNTKKSNYNKCYILSFIIFTLLLFVILRLLHFLLNRLQSEQVSVSQVVSNMCNYNSLSLAKDLLNSDRKTLSELIEATTVS